MFCYVLLCVMLLSQQRETDNCKKGGQRAEQLPGKIKGAVIVPTVKLRGFVFLGAKIGVSAVLGHCSFESFG